MEMMIDAAAFSVEISGFFYVEKKERSKMNTAKQTMTQFV